MLVAIEALVLASLEFRDSDAHIRQAFGDHDANDVLDLIRRDPRFVDALFNGAAEVNNWDAHQASRRKLVRTRGRLTADR